MRNLYAMRDLFDRSPPDVSSRAQAVEPSNAAWVALALVLALPWLNPFSPGPSSSAVPMQFSWFCAALVLLALTLRVRAMEGIDLVRLLALSWSLAALLSAVIGLIQYGGASAQFGVWINPVGPGEAFGNLRQRNQFSTLMAIGLASLLWWARRVPTRGGLIAGVLVAALLGAGSAASSSRTGMMEMLLLAALVLIWLRGLERAAARRVVAVVLSALLAYALAMLVLPWLIGLDPFGNNAWARLRSGDSVCASRLTLWGNVLQLISQKPWSGWGWGELDYAHFIHLYPGARFCDILDNAHNLPLHLAVELGLPLAVLLTGGAIGLIWRACPWAERQPGRQLAWSVLAVLGLHSLLEYPLWYGPFQLAALASLGVLGQPWWASVQARRSVLQTLGPQLLRALAQLVLLACAVAAWNYRIASQIYLPPEQRASAYQQDTLARSQGLWLYANQVRFAELTTLPLTADNAPQVRDLALEMLHFSPEARVVCLLIEADQLLDKTDEQAFYTARLKAAFAPQDARCGSSQ